MQTQQQKQEFYEFEAAQLRMTFALQMGYCLVLSTGDIVCNKDPDIQGAIETANTGEALKKLAAKDGVTGLVVLPLRQRAG